MLCIGHRVQAVLACVSNVVEQRVHLQYGCKANVCHVKDIAESFVKMSVSAVLFKKTVYKIVEIL